MTIKHNQKIIRNHLRKDWQSRVHTHFDQAGLKKHRREARQAKAAAIAPRPLGLLRPVVRCPTIKHNRRLRSGRGFSLSELKAAGLNRRYAQTIGIAVDGRRRNLSEESLATNVKILKDYLERLIVLPKNKDSAELLADVKIAAVQSHNVQLVDKTVQEISKSDMPAPIEGGAYRKLRDSWAFARHEGAREKRVRDAAAAEEAKK